MLSWAAGRLGQSGNRALGGLAAAATSRDTGTRDSRAIAYRQRRLDRYRLWVPRSVGCRTARMLRPVRGRLEGAAACCRLWGTPRLAVDPAWLGGGTTRWETCPAINHSWGQLGLTGARLRARRRRTGAVAALPIVRPSVGSEKPTLPPLRHPVWMVFVVKPPLAELKWRRTLVSTRRLGRQGKRKRSNLRGVQPSPRRDRFSMPTGTQVRRTCQACLSHRRCTPLEIWLHQAGCWWWQLVVLCPPCRTLWMEMTFGVKQLHRASRDIPTGKAPLPLEHQELEDRPSWPRRSRRGRPAGLWNSA